MSVSTLAHPPRHGAALAKFWIAVALLVAAGVGLAWFGAGSMRGETYPSGLVIRTLSEGSGPTIGLQDGVLINYEGRLADGTVFDGSAGRGPAPIVPAQTIPGFAEALTKMRGGGSYNIRIPSELAYGESPPPGLPPNADLEFDVEIVQVIPNAGMQAPQPQPQPQPQPE